MKHDFEIEIQALIDGELSPRQARRVETRIACGADAQLLAAELRQVRQVLSANEPAPALPESRDFFWSKIERQIQLQANAPVAVSRSWFSFWPRVAMPMAGVAAVACALLLQGNRPKFPAYDDVSMNDSGMEALTFHDQSAHMTVVWLQDNNQNVEPAPSEPSLEIPSDDGNSEASM